MKQIGWILLAITLMLNPAFGEDGWVSLFDGKTLDGWKKAVENPDTLKVEDGKLVVDGPRSHLFYDGPVENANFKNFELKLEVYIYPGSNSGIYIHTRYKDSGWPDRGYEAQVNNTHKDIKKTGGLYAVKDVLHKSPVKDKEWFEYHLIVQGKRIILKINGEVTTDYTEPDDLDRPDRQLSSGTIAIQGHDPKSRVEYRNIRIKPLPDTP